MWSLKDNLKRKTAHFRFPFVAQKRRELKVANYTSASQTSNLKLNVFIDLKAKNIYLP